MICCQCGAGIGDDCRFCPYCGAAQPETEFPAAPAAPSHTAEKPKKRKESGAAALLAALAVLLVALLVLAAVFWKTRSPASPASIRDAVSAMKSAQEPEPEPEPSANAAGSLSGDDLSALSQSVAALYVFDSYDSYIASGSGFIAFADDLILTNFHVIAGAWDVTVEMPGGGLYWAEEVVYADEYADLAVLRLNTPTGLPVLSIGDSEQVRVGDTVYAMGYPLDLGLTVSNGILSAIRREDSYVDFQITAPISSGSSGGALLNDKGEVIGVTYATYDDGQNLNLAIPSSEFQDLDLSQALSMDEFSVQYASYGNSFENYSAQNADFVNYGGTWLSSWTDGSQIELVGPGKPLAGIGLSGVWLSVYRDVLYFLPPSRDAICAYDLETETLEENLLLSYPNRAQVSNIQKLFVTDYGFTLIYETAAGDAALLQLDFYGGVVGHLTDRDYSAAILVEGLEAACPIPETNSVRYISLYDLNDYDMEVDFPIGDRLSYGGGEYLCATDRTQPDVIRRFNMYSEEVQTLRPAHWDGGAFLVTQDTICYSGGGVWLLAFGEEEPTLLDEAEHLSDLNFIGYNSYFCRTAGPDSQILLIDMVGKTIS